ncbi:MAG TPA: M90 family metallopeptidase [Agriterribacter sp.]|nr:M90 family metallopeptidase [Agriterribacter sp.]
MLDNFLLFLLFGAALMLILLLISRIANKPRPAAELPETYRLVLQNNVAFYNTLKEDDAKSFEQRVQHFLSTVRITGVRTNVDDLDRVLIGASAIIPIFGFADWEYINLDEVLLYPETFSEAFEQTGNQRSVLGMVGDGPMHRTMILSKFALREGFSNKTGKDNTAIHEFVHLIDKTDGAVDGVPEVLLQHRYVLPWINLMHREIKEIVSNESDINPYGATSQPEFFAVASEYFFERPGLLEKKHPELYRMLEKIFHQGKDIPFERHDKMVDPG